ncbi:SDR family oxidoreductase [Blastomonas marina]|uniref:Short-chain dehydrogenase n=1 Tax=Blastomonas marina TaxID=1867408 RepID=A0ABQ1FCS9_9SPHN|nr:SDR family oxidoreductase [Blastomonas marina]WPZ05215.1 SDR family oxidoreductase [Blastomonas marina]GGA06749.1 short-chain dehydrogenase [Blastomonas marina]
MTFDFSGKHALVTGAASGIGAATARRLAADGVDTLHLVDPDGDGLDALDLACTVHRHVADVSDEAFWNEFDAAEHRLDLALANAGIGSGGQIADLELAEWRKVMAVNLDGAFLTLRSALRAMKLRGGGSAVITASITGVKPVPGIGPYGVSKAGAAHLARIAAAENAAHGIRVNAIAPGGVDTAIWESSPDFRKSAAEQGREATIAAMGAMSPRGRFATADEIAGEIAFLLSDLAGNVTGTVHVTDGGYSL